MDISYDAFVRTTDAKHEAVVKALLESVWDAGDIYKASYSGRYCVGCEEFKDDEDLDADGNCLIHRTPCPVREEVRRRLRHGVGHSQCVRMHLLCRRLRDWV